MAPRKRLNDAVGTLVEPAFSELQWRCFREGIDLFNASKYWYAHEAWEQVWLDMPDDESGDAEIILRGMIQLAAAMHLLSIGRLEGATNNFRKAAEKLALAPPRLLGVDFVSLRDFAEREQRELDGELICRIEAV